jgi:hypothetical protein
VNLSFGNPASEVDKESPPPEKLEQQPPISLDSIRFDENEVVTFGSVNQLAVPAFSALSFMQARSVISASQEKEKEKEREELFFACARQPMWPSKHQRPPPVSYVCQKRLVPLIRM